MIFLLKVLIPAVVGSVTQAIVKSRLETPEQKLDRILSYLSLEDYAVLAAMVMAQQEGDLPELLATLDPDEVTRIWTLTECMQMEMYQDLPR